MVRNIKLLGFLALMMSMNSGIADSEQRILDVKHHGIPHDALYGLCFKGATGIAVGQAGAVVGTKDYGKSWVAETSSTNLSLFGASCGESSTIAVGQSGHIQLRTGEGDWAHVDSGIDARLLNVDSNSDGLTFAVGGFGAVIRSTDGGYSWNTIPFDWEKILDDFVEPHLYDVEVFDDGTVIVVGEFELVLLSTDAGQTWTVVNKAESSLFAVHFHGRNEGFATGQKGRLLATTDGGKTWKKMKLPVEENMLDVWSTESGSVLITGIRSLLRSEDGGDEWRSYDYGDISRKWYQSVGGVKENESGEFVNFMVGHSGRIVLVPN